MFLKNSEIDFLVLKQFFCEFAESIEQGLIKEVLGSKPKRNGAANRIAAANNEELFLNLEEAFYNDSCGSVSGNKDLRPLATRDQIAARIAQSGNCPKEPSHHQILARARALHCNRI